MKALIYTLAIIKTEDVECNHTHELVDQYTLDTPHSHQCGFIAKAVQSIEEFRNFSSWR